VDLLAQVLAVVVVVQVKDSQALLLEVMEVMARLFLLGHALYILLPR